MTSDPELNADDPEETTDELPVDEDTEGAVEPDEDQEEPQLETANPGDPPEDAVSAGSQ